MSNQIVAVVLNPFQKLASVRRFAAGNGTTTMDGYHQRAYTCTCDGKQRERAIFVALRRYVRDEWCQNIVTSDLTVDQADDIIRHLNRSYLAQGYKLLQNEKLV